MFPALTPSGCPLQGCRAAGDKSKRVACWTERDWPTLRTKIAELTTASATRKTKEMQNLGLNKTVFAFHPKYFPHVNPVRIAPNDALHLFPDGLLRMEGASLFYILFNLGLGIDAANAAIRKYKGFPRDVCATPTPPHITLFTCTKTHSFYP